VRKHHKTFEKAVAASCHKMGVNYTNGKLHISPEAFRDLFKTTIDSLISLIGKLLDNPKLSDLRTILMVGGFSECELVQDAIRDKIGSSIKLIIPEEAGLAVLKGAVLFGHQPKIVSRRIAKITYGIQSWPEWDADLHPVSKKVDRNGKTRCRDVFLKYITIGDSIESGHAVSKVFQALNPEETTLQCNVYRSTDENPRFITDPTCQRLGILIIQLPPYTPGQTREIEETLIFGETELLCRAKDLRTGSMSEVQLDLL
jgi:molecular chaperone DnaK (HSP70)